MSKLNTCQKCGDNEAVGELVLDSFFYKISCARCGTETQWYENRNNAIAEWNSKNEVEE